MTVLSRGKVMFSLGQNFLAFHFQSRRDLQFSSFIDTVPEPFFPLEFDFL
jgi:hypothetical protein